MKTLNPSMLPPTEQSTTFANSTSDRMLFAAERAKVLFSSYRRGDANDPDRYLASIIAVLSEYPEETIRFVTDPRTGIQNRFPDWMPNVPQVKLACEEHYGPTRRAIEREANERRQLAERNTLAISDNRPRKTYEELIADCQARGLNIGPKKPGVEAIDGFLAEYGVSREQFDAMPDLPINHGVRR